MVALIGKYINYKWDLHFAKEDRYYKRHKSDTTKLWGATRAEINTCSKWAFMNETAKRNDRRVMRGGTDKQMLYRITYPY